METNVKDLESMEAYRRELDVEPHGENLNKQSVCSTGKKQVQTRREETLEEEVRSKSAKTLNYDENYATNNVVFPSQSLNYHCRFHDVSRNATADAQRNSTPRRTPLHELNCKNKQEKNKQAIWRPW